MSTATTSQYCNIHHSNHNSDSLLDKVWNRLSHALSQNIIRKDPNIQHDVLREQQNAELHNLSRRSTDVQRMLMRHVL